MYIRPGDYFNLIEAGFTEEEISDLDGKINYLFWDFNADQINLFVEGYEFERFGNGISLTRPNCKELIEGIFRDFNLPVGTKKFTILLANKRHRLFIDDIPFDSGLNDLRIAYIVCIHLTKFSRNPNKSPAILKKY